MQRTFHRTEARFLLPYNDGEEARGKTEKRRPVGTFNFILGWKYAQSLCYKNKCIFVIEKWQLFQCY